MSLWLGIDAGSVAVKAVVIDAAGRLRYDDCRSTEGRLVERLGTMSAALPEGPYAGAAVTGTGKDLLARLTGLPALNEIAGLASGAAAASLLEGAPPPRTIIDIGGQDAKLIILAAEKPAVAAEDLGGAGNEEPCIEDFVMNDVCAAGTGAFLEHQARRLGLTLAELGRLALRSERPAPVAGRCAVFAKSDIVHLLQQGRSLADVLAGLCRALARSCRTALVKHRRLPGPVHFIGGVAVIPAVVRALQEELGIGIVVPPHPRVRGAVGAALYARQSPRAFDRSELAAILARADGPTARPRLGLNNGRDRPEKRSGGAKPLVSPGDRRIPNAGPAAGPRPVIEFPEPSTNRVPEPSGPAATVPVPDDGGGGADPRPFWLGIDVGAASVKLAAIDDGQRLLAVHYALSRGDSAAALRRGLAALGAHPRLGAVRGAGITGSGRRLFGAWLGADLAVDEISAQARAAAALLAAAGETGGTVVDIGGEDAKFIRVGVGGRVVRFTMNAICSAGTGAFLDEQAGRLEIALADLGRLALAASRPVVLDAKCTVFMASDLVQEMQRGAGREALAAGIVRAVVENYLEKTAAGERFEEPLLFVGGVAANPGVVAALEARLGRPVRVPAEHLVSGAVGAALLVREAAPAATGFRGFDPGPLEATASSFACSGCEQRCTIDRIAVRDKVYHRGSACGRFDAPSGTAAGPDLLKARQDLLFACAGLEDPCRSPEAAGEPARSGGSASFGPGGAGVPPAAATPPDPRPDIGLPRIFFFYDLLPLWAAFFRHLGLGVTLSPSTSRGILDEGLAAAPVDACLPVKAACGHVRSLLASASGPGPEWVFVPGFPDRPPSPDTGFPKSLHCAYKASFRSFLEGDAERAGRGARDPRILCPSLGRDLFDPEAFHHAVGRELGFSRAATAAAWRHGLEAQAEFAARSAALGRTAAGGGPRLVLLGRRYVLYDPLLSLRVPAKLRAAGHAVVPFDLLPARGDAFPGGWRDTVFAESQDILRAARAVAAEPDLHPVFISHFGCGVDAFLVKSLERLFEGKRWLRLELDEHSGEAGLETRCEAFLRSLGRAPGRPGYSPPDCTPVRGRARSPARGPAYVIPDNGDNFLAVRAALRSRGRRAEMLPRGDAASLRLGNARSSGRECLAYRFLLGDALKWSGTDGAGGAAAAPRPGSPREERVLFLPGLDHCLAHHYASEIARALQETGRPERVVGGRICPAADEVVRIAGLRGLRVFWKTWVAVDYLQRLHREKRAAAADQKPACDAIYDRALARLRDNTAFARIQPILEEAAAALASVPGDGRPRPAIGIVGEPYTIFNPHANGFLLDAIEDLGGVAWLPPHVTDYFRYIEQRRFRTSRRRGDPACAVHWLRVNVQARDEAAVAAVFAGRLRNYPEPGPDESLRLARGYMTEEDDVLAVFTAAKALDFAAKGAAGILNLMSFQCLVGYKAAASLERIRRDLGVPMLHLVLDGGKDLHARNRLEAFLHQLSRARRVGLPPS